MFTLCPRRQSLSTTGVNRICTGGCSIKIGLRRRPINLPSRRPIRIFMEQLFRKADSQIGFREGWFSRIGFHRRPILENRPSSKTCLGASLPGRLILIVHTIFHISQPLPIILHLSYIKWEVGGSHIPLPLPSADCIYVISMSALHVKNMIWPGQNPKKNPEAEFFSGPLGTLGEYLSAI